MTHNVYNNIPGEVPTVEGEILTNFNAFKEFLQRISNNVVRILSFCIENKSTAIAYLIPIPTKLYFLPCLN